MSSDQPSSNANTPRRPSIWWLDTLLVALATLGSALTFYLIFAVAPNEQQMGVVQKIFYFHVPSAYAMYVSFVICSAYSFFYLRTRNPKHDAYAIAGAEVGLLFAAIVCITGPLWARKAWGTYWTWDPRITTTFLTSLVYGSYAALRSGKDSGEVEKRFAAALSVLGLFLLPIIHYSVKAWRGQHPTVITQQGGGLHPQMWPALISGFVLMTAISVLFVRLRAKQEQQAHQIDQLRDDWDSES